MTETFLQLRDDVRFIGICGWQRDVAALAGNGLVMSVHMNQTGDTKARARTNQHARQAGDHATATHLDIVPRSQQRYRVGQCLKVIDHVQLFQAQGFPEGRAI